MKRKTAFLLTSLILVSIACLCRIDARKLLLGCYWQECAPERDFHVLDWKIPASFFPPVAKVSDMYISSEGSGEIEWGSQAAFWDNGVGIAGYDIYRYPTVAKANTQYEHILNRMADRETKRPWDSDIFTFTSSSADEIFIACGTWTEKRCGMLARYQEYVIFFNATMDEKMSYSDFEEIMIYLDEQISSRLYP
jgi:hypothetical protein